MVKRHLNKKGDTRGLHGTLPKNINGTANGHWKGGRTQRGDGYVLIRLGVIPKNAKGARYKLEHRIVMEKHLGRLLSKNEIVHHKNGKTSDNRIENLEVMTQAEHAKIHVIKDNKTGRIINNKVKIKK